MTLTFLQVLSERSRKNIQTDTVANSEIPPPQDAGYRKVQTMAKARNSTVQAVDLLRSNGVNWQPEAKSPGGGSFHSRMRSKASRAAGNAGPATKAELLIPGTECYQKNKIDMTDKTEFIFLPFKSFHRREEG